MTFSVWGTAGMSASLNKIKLSPSVSTMCEDISQLSHSGFSPSCRGVPHVRDFQRGLLGFGEAEPLNLWTSQTVFINTEHHPREHSPPLFVFTPPLEQWVYFLTVCRLTQCLKPISWVIQTSGRRLFLGEMTRWATSLPCPVPVLCVGRALFIFFLYVVC